MTPDDRNPFGRLLSATMQTLREPMTPDMIGVWWGALSPYEFASVRAAFSDHVKDPEKGKWTPKPADIIGRIKAYGTADVPRLTHKRQPPDPRVLDAIKGMARRRQPRGQWWTPDRVENQSQVDFITMQARQFGEMSQQGRFLEQCINAGIITPDGRLGVWNTREPGEDPVEQEIEAI